MPKKRNRRREFVVERPWEREVVWDSVCSACFEAAESSLAVTCRDSKELLGTLSSLCKEYGFVADLLKKKEKEAGKNG